MNMIQKILPIVCLMLVGSTTYAQDKVPQGMSYQAVARNVSGDPMVDRAISVRVNILEDNASGTLSYSESHNISTNEFGSFNLQLGMGTPITGVFADVAWGYHDHFMNVELDEDGGTNYVDMGTTQLLSVPYALFSGESSFDAEQNDRLSTLQDLIDFYHPFTCGDPLYDVRDGNVYATTLVGSQCWMAEGLRYDLDATGESLASYAQDQTNIDVAGRYYSWAGALDIDPIYNTTLYSPTGDIQGACPTGWHVPSDADMIDLLLATNVGVNGELGIGGTSGMEIELSGDYGSSFTEVGMIGFLGISTEIDETFTKPYQLLQGGATTANRPKTRKMNIRCLKD